MTLTVYIQTDPSTFVLAKPTFSVYLDALEYGQRMGGFGMFYVDTEDRVPDRATQLGSRHSRYLPTRKTNQSHKYDPLADQD